VDGYKAPATSPTNKYGNKLSESIWKAINVILGGLTGSIFVKFMYWEFAKDIWKKIKIFMKEMPKSKGPSCKLIEVNLYN
jgi:hypothetical protein